MKITKTENQQIGTFSLTTGTDNLIDTSVALKTPEFLDVSVALTSNVIQIVTNEENAKACDIELEPKDILHLMKWLAGQYEHIRR